MNNWFEGYQRASIGRKSTAKRLLGIHFYGSKGSKNSFLHRPGHRSSCRAAYHTGEFRYPEAHIESSASLHARRLKTPTGW